MGPAGHGHLAEGPPRKSVAEPGAERVRTPGERRLAGDLEWTGGERRQALAALGPDRRSGGEDESKTNWKNASEQASHGGALRVSGWIVFFKVRRRPPRGSGSQKRNGSGWAAPVRTTLATAETSGGGSC